MTQLQKKEATHLFLHGWCDLGKVVQRSLWKALRDSDAQDREDVLNLSRGSVCVCVSVSAATLHVMFHGTFIGYIGP